MDYEQRFFEQLVDSYMAAGDITEDEAIFKIKKMKKEEPEEYQEELTSFIRIDVYF